MEAWLGPGEFNERIGGCEEKLVFLKWKVEAEGAVFFDAVIGEAFIAWDDHEGQIGAIEVFHRAWYSLVPQSKGPGGWDRLGWSLNLGGRYLEKIDLAAWG